MGALDCLFLHTIQTKQGGYECYHIPTHQVITQPYITFVPTTPTIIAMINALGKSNGTLSTSVIEAQEGCDIATCDIPNIFVQTHVEEKDKDGNQTIMKIRGVHVDILCEINPISRDYTVTDGN